MSTSKSKRTIESGKRARVLVVDDSQVMRKLILMALQNDPQLEVIGTAQNGREALEKLAKLTPDAVTMDIEMPEMDGLEALRHIRQLAPQTRVVMLSTLTERGGSATLEALSLGADDYLTKHTAGKSIEESTANLRAELAPKIKQFFSFSTSAARSSQETAATPTQPATVQAVRSPTQNRSLLLVPEYSPRVLVIGVSTGGPTALGRIIPEFPDDFRLPILIVQHMPPLFTRLLAERLQERAHLPVHEGVHGDSVEGGNIYLAPGDYHMRVQMVPGERQPRIALDKGPQENSCRPAVDVLFESVAGLYGGATVAAVLTGMGQDGLRGARLLKKAGATIFAQDEETSAVWGMPRAIAEAKLADAVLPLDEIVPQLLRSCQRIGRDVRGQAGQRSQERHECLK